MSSTDAAGVKKRQRGRKNNSAAAGGGGSGKATTKAPAAARTPIDPNASDESLLVESPQQFALRMRKLLATLFREQAQATGDRYPLAAPKLGTSQSFSSEQIWGQLSVLYAPVLKKAAKSVSRLRVSEEEEDADAPSAAPAAKKKGSKKATFADEEYDDEDDASMSGGFSDSAASVALSSDAEVDKLESRLRRRNRGGKRGGKGVDPDAWRYALGKPSELEDEDLSEDDDAIGDDDMAPKHKRGRDEAAELDAGDDDDLEGLEDDFEGESDMAGDGDEEEELGDDASEADSAAALRELYGSDAEAGDDDDDEERDDDDDDDPMNEENFDEFMDDRSSQGVADDEDDDGAAAAASPFGPAAAPENPLDFTDIDNNKKLTAFEKDEQKRLRVARDLEMSRVHGADWAMKGEVAAGARPRDSLIDTTLDFEHALPPAPVITEYFTGKLEDRIKRRVADNNFDDVERKVLQTAPEDLQSTKRDEALDAQKSKLSLMDLYEKEFLEKQAAAERAEGGPAMAEALTEIERDELKAVQMWKRLSQHLDALSNFYFTPKPVNPEVEARVRAVQNQAPAITLEPVGMNAVAKEDVLAPQDVFRPKRGIHTDAAGSELTSDERKAIRRAAKANTKAAEGRKEKQHAANDKKKTAAKKASGGDAAGKKS